jgi:hypothetical protein
LVGNCLDSETFSLAVLDVDGGEFAALDLVQNGLAGESECVGGLGERQPPVRRVLADAGA